MDLVLDIIQHKGQTQIAVIFPYDFELKEYIKKFEGIKWSASKSLFYLLYSKDNLSNLIYYINLKTSNFDQANVLEFVIAEDINNLFQETHLRTIEAFGKWMAQKRYSDNTINTYKSSLIIFFKYYYFKAIGDITQKDITRFNHNYFIKNNYSYTAQNQCISALKLFYKKYNEFDIDLELIERPKKSNHLPQVLSIGEVESILNASRNLKHKMILSTIYSAGLRIGEALNLKISDIDSGRMLIRVENAKGNKDRYVPLSEKLLLYLREYFKIYRPKIYLFEGKYGGKYTQSSSRSILKQALHRTKIKRGLLYIL